MAVELIKRGRAYVDHQVWHIFLKTHLCSFLQHCRHCVLILKRFLCGLCQLQTADEIKLYRAEKKDSPWRDRPISESLKLFSDMRRGLIDEGKATLRMKQDMQNENFNMYDLIAYRIKVMTLLSILNCVSCLWQM